MASNAVDNSLKPSEKALAWSGKEHKWAISPLTRLNVGLKALVPTFVLVTFAIYFDNSDVGRGFYQWLNARYTKWEINVYWTFGITTIAYWIGGLMFMAVDLWKPASLYKYKIQPAQSVTVADYRKVCWVVARNQLFVVLPLLVLVGTIMPLETSAPLPSARRTLGTFIFGMICEEIGFFYCHRMFHSPMFYKYVHKMHHEYTAPVALSSTYCSMIEHAFSNIFPILLGIEICRAHWGSMILFFCSLLCGTLCSHSGYNIPFAFGALRHDWHHYTFTENYGPTGLLDTFHGTDVMFNAWLAELDNRDGGSGKTVGETVAWGREEIATREAARDTPVKHAQAL